MCFLSSTSPPVQIKIAAQETAACDIIRHYITHSATFLGVVFFKLKQRIPAAVTNFDQNLRIQFFQLVPNLSITPSPPPAALMAFITVAPSLSSSFTPRLHVTSRRQSQPVLSRRLVMAADGAPTARQTPAKQAPEEGEPVSEIILDENIGSFCSIDPRTGKRLEVSLREKESVFLDAVQAYFRGESTLSNEEFDNLKEELTWQGSDVVTLNRDEFRFLDAAKAYEQGKPVMDDVEFDKLKQKLQREGSVVAIQRGPRCSIQRQITFSDVIPDKRRTFVLYLPAGVLTGLIWLSVAFELTPLRTVDPVLSLILGSPIIFFAARLITGLVVPKAEIMVGDCPSCGRRTHVLFGNVLNQKGFENSADLTCEKCKAKLRVDRESGRMILISQG